ncbi:MAG: hypothetical protein V4668_02885 [Patescibacteria group bacterium]
MRQKNIFIDFVETFLQRKILFKELNDALVLSKSKRLKILAPKITPKNLWQEALGVSMVSMFWVASAIFVLVLIFFVVGLILGPAGSVARSSVLSSLPLLQALFVIFFLMTLAFLHVFLLQGNRIEHKKDSKLNYVTKYIYLDNKGMLGRLNFLWKDIQDVQMVEDKSAEIYLKEQFPLSIILKSRAYVLTFVDTTGVELFLSNYKKQHGDTEGGEVSVNAITPPVLHTS